MKLIKKISAQVMTFIHRLFKSKGLVTFLMAMSPNSQILDVGCGNNSPLRFKRMRPDFRYIGLDICDHYQTDLSISVADEYVLVNPERFAQAIEKYEGKLDAVISSHNLEHCNKPDDVLQAMAKALKPGGRMYIAFPCEDSVNFPSRRSTLNFYDDKTHRTVPKFERVCSILDTLGLEIEFVEQRYRPLLLFCMGFLFEPLSRLLNIKIPGGTWALYGFESVIWASLPGKLS